MPLSDAVRCMVHAFSDAGRKADVRQIADKIAELERENAALRDEARLWKETCYGLGAPHYILDPDLRASKFREALLSYSAITRKIGLTIGSAQPEAQL